MTAIVIVVALAAILVFQRGERDQPNQLNTQLRETSNSIDAGYGYWEPPAHLKAVLESLPLYPSAVVDNRLRLTLSGEANAFYHINATAEEIIAFYITKLPSRGWVLEQVPTTQIIPAKGVDGIAGSSTTAIWGQDDIQVHMFALQRLYNPTPLSQLRILVIDDSHDLFKTR